MHLKAVFTYTMQIYVSYKSSAYFSYRCIFPCMWIMSADSNHTLHLWHWQWDQYFRLWSHELWL